MGEVINVSCSQFSNHILTHLYNHQESHIPYKSDSVVLHDNKVFLSQNKVNGRSNYYPRALVYDARNGFGSLGQYEYYGLENHKNIPTGVEVINTDPKIPKNEFQKGLDKGQNKAHLLDETNTNYWTDYNKLIYRPDSLISLEDWHLHNNETVNRFTPSMKFTNYNVGQDAFEKVEEASLDVYRKLLEESDYFHGMQLISESDSAWSGFTNEFLVKVKDEFFNYTSNNKFNMWVWDVLKTGTLNYHERITRIHSLVQFSKNASLVIPLTPPLVGNNWQKSSVLSVPINATWELINSAPRVADMKSFELSILGNDFNRNIVNILQVNELKQQEMTKLSLYDLEEKQEMSLGFNKKKADKFSTTYIMNELDADLFKNTDKDTVYLAKNDIMGITHDATFPDTIGFDKASVEFSIDTGIRYDIKKYIEFISRSNKSIELIVGDKEELLNDLYDLKRIYNQSPEFEDDSDEYDD